MIAVGWKAPRNSTELVYPDGLNKDATDDEINISFAPTPNYAMLAEGATGGDFRGQENQWMRGVRVRTVKEFEDAFEVAKERVLEKEKGMLIEILM
jgi:hypothetical protein